MTTHTLIAQADIFGKVSPPPGVASYDTQAGGGIGLIAFVSTLLQIATVLLGLWVFMQFFFAGYEYVTSSGDTGAHNKVKDRLTMSITGLVIIVGSYSIAALLGLIFFGDATFIINPKLESIVPTTP